MGKTARVTGGKRDTDLALTNPPGDPGDRNRIIPHAPKIFGGRMPPITGIVADLHGDIREFPKVATKSSTSRPRTLR